MDDKKNRDTAGRVSLSGQAAEPAIATEELCLWYGDFQALFNVNFRVKRGLVTALIGPSGCGKSTLLRSVNRINERYGYVRTTGNVKVLGKNIYDADVEPVQLRKCVGMVFQRPNPLPISIRDNVLFGYQIHTPRFQKAPVPGQTSGGDYIPKHKKITKSDRENIVEKALRQVLLWDQVKDRLNHRATGLSLEEQQKLCIARLLPVKPDLLLMDEPCSALDPKATAVVEELIWTLRGRFTILIVTHNMAQARRASDECAFMLMGKMVEHSKTEKMFVTPAQSETADYIEGRYG